MTNRRDSSVSSVNRHVTDSATRFGQLWKSGGWARGWLVATSVFPGRPEYRANAEAVAAGKVSTSEFALMSGVSDDTIRKVLHAWNDAAEAGKVQPSAELDPGDDMPDDLTEDALGKFEEFYNRTNLDPEDLEIADLEAEFAESEQRASLTTLLAGAESAEEAQALVDRAWANPGADEPSVQPSEVAKPRRSAPEPWRRTKLIERVSQQIASSVHEIPSDELNTTLTYLSAAISRMENAVKVINSRKEETCPPAESE